MILHAVYCAIRDDVADVEIDRVFSGLAALQNSVPGILSVDVGPNIDLERKSQSFTHGFVMRFADRAALEAYATHPAHVAAGGALVAICQGGADGIMVFDLDI